MTIKNRLRAVLAFLAWSGLSLGCSAACVVQDGPGEGWRQLLNYALLVVALAALGPATYALLEMTRPRPPRARLAIESGGLHRARGVCAVRVDGAMQSCTVPELVRSAQQRAADRRARAESYGRTADAMADSMRVRRRDPLVS